MLSLTNVLSDLFSMKSPPSWISDRWFKTLRLRQNGRNFADDIFKRIFLYANCFAVIQIQLEWEPKGPINKKWALEISTVYSKNVADSSLLWRHNGRDGVSNHQPRDRLLNHSFSRRSKKTSKLRVTGLCMGIHRWPVNFPHEVSVTRKLFPFHDVIMSCFDMFVMILYRTMLLLCLNI